MKNQVFLHSLGMGPPTEPPTSVMLKKWLVEGGLEDGGCEVGVAYPFRERPCGGAKFFIVVEMEAVVDRNHHALW